jgi:hypothetical protein
MLGLGVPSALCAREPGTHASEKSCIFIVMGGGPSHVDIWDMLTGTEDSSSFNWGGTVQLKKEFMGSTAGKVMDVSETDAKALFDNGIAEPATGDPIAGILSKAVGGAIDTISGAMNSSPCWPRRSRKKSEPARPTGILPPRGGRHAAGR